MVDGGAGETPPDQQLLADQLATRHVPTVRAGVDYGLPTKPEARTTQPPFERPELESMGPPTTALLVGRSLFAIAALLVGVASRRSTGVGGDDRAAAFWPVTISAGVFVLVGVAGLIYWSVTLADNARRLKTRSATPRGMGWSWIVVIGWVAVSCVTYLQIEIEGELDPLPGVAAIGWAITLAIAYGRLQGIFRGLSRTPPIVWLTAFPLDLFAFGLIWWRLTDWPSPVGGDWDHVRFTSNVAFGAAAALMINALVFGWLAQKASNGVYERLGRLEAQSRSGDDEPNPQWFQAGLAARQALAPPVVARPLIGTKHLATAVSVLHVLWGAALVVFGILVAALAFEYSGEAVFLDEDLAVTDSDTAALTLVGGIVGFAYLAAIVTHGVWAVLSAINARRVTVHSPNPATFAIAFAPMPLLVVAGLLIGGRLGYWLAVIGLSIAFFALILVNQMLMALSARLGGQLRGFSQWTLCIMLTYFAGVVLNFLFAQAAAQLGLYATLSFIQGVLIAIGGVIGYRAMRALEETLRTHRRTNRVDVA